MIIASILCLIYVARLIPCIFDFFDASRGKLLLTFSHKNRNVSIYRAKLESNTVRSGGPNYRGEYFILIGDNMERFSKSKFTLLHEICHIENKDMIIIPLKLMTILVLCWFSYIFHEIYWILCMTLICGYFSWIKYIILPAERNSDLYAIRESSKIDREDFIKLMEPSLENGKLLRNSNEIFRLIIDKDGNLRDIYRDKLSDRLNIIRKSA
jgi:hypothetical protein